MAQPCVGPPVCASASPARRCSVAGGVAPREPPAGRRPRATNELEQFEVHRSVADSITAILASGRQRSRRRVRRRLRRVGRCVHDRTSRIDVVGRSPFCVDQVVVRFRRTGVTRRQSRSPLWPDGPAAGAKQRSHRSFLLGCGHPAPLPLGKSGASPGRANAPRRAAGRCTMSARSADAGLVLIGAARAQTARVDSAGAAAIVRARGEGHAIQYRRVTCLR
jgi:hypothetical protein